MSVSADASYDDISSITDFANSDNPLVTIWQSFTATTTDYLYGVQLYAKTPDTVVGGQVRSAVGINIVIYDGPNPTFPVFTQLTATTVAAQPAGWVSFVFPSPFTSLVNGAQYTIEVGGSGAENFLWGYAFVTPSTGYAGGTASFQPPSNLFFVVQKIPIPTNPNIPNTFATIEVGDGSVLAPSYTFTSEPTTGFYHTPSTVNFTSAGVAIMRLNSDGIEPADDDTVDIGTGSNRFRDLYLGNAGHNGFFARTTGVTATIRGTAGDPIVTYVTTSGYMIKIGTFMFISGYVSWNALVGGAGNVFIELGGPTLNVQPDDVAIINIVASNIGPYPAGATIAGSIPAGPAPLIINLIYNVPSAPIGNVAITELPAIGEIYYTGSFPNAPFGGP
jgi:hypothetical protein